MPVTAIALAQRRPTMPPRVVALYRRTDWPMYATTAELAEYVGRVAEAAGPGCCVLAWGLDETPPDMLEIVPAERRD